jgi:hypothetical protein
MSDDEKLNLLLKFDHADLDRLQQRYAKVNDSAGVAMVDRALAAKGPPAQTEALSNCGKLFRHSYTDSETGQRIHRCVGDWATAFAPFQPDEAQIVKFDYGAFTGANSPQAKALAQKEREERAEFEAFRAARNAAVKKR